MPIRPDLLRPGQRVRLSWTIDRMPCEVPCYYIGHHGREYRFQAAPLCPIVALMALDDGTLRDDKYTVAEVLDADPS